MRPRTRHFLALLILLATASPSLAQDRQGLPAKLGAASKQEAAPKQDAPAKQDAASKQDALAKQDTASRQDASAKQDMPAKQDTLTKQDMPAKQDSVSKQDASAKQDAPPVQDTSAKQDTTSKQDAPPKQDTPAKQDAASKQDTPTKKPRVTWEAHFAQANTAHDGRLTLEEAQSGYKTIAKHYRDIDTNGKGYVTENDVRAWRAMPKPARHATQPDDPLRPRPAFQNSGPPQRTMLKASTHAVIRTSQARQP